MFDRGPRSRILVGLRRLLRARDGMSAVRPELWVCLVWAATRAGPSDARCCSSVVERVLGKDEVMGSSPISSFSSEGVRLLNACRRMDEGPEGECFGFVRSACFRGSVT